MQCSSPLASLLLAVFTADQDPATVATSTTRVVEGQVVDLRGEGVPIARVIAFDAETEEALVRVVTDGDGMFRLPRVPRDRRVELRALAEGYCEGRSPVFGGEAPLRIEVHHAATLRGVVRNGAGRPIPGASVRAKPCGRFCLGEVLCDTRADEDGRFVLERVPLGPVKVVAFVASEGVFASQLCVARDTEIELKPVDEARTTIEVHVTGLPERDVPTVRLALRAWRPPEFRAAPPELESFLLPPPLDRPVIGADGRWGAHSMPDTGYEIAPQATGATFTPPLHRLEPGRGPHSVTFTFTPATAQTVVFRALVRDARGEPIRGVTLHAATESRVFVTAVSDHEGVAAFTGPFVDGEPVTIRALQGDHTVHIAEPGEHVDMQPWNWSRLHTVVDTGAPISLALIPVCRVQGRLVLLDGRPAAFAAVDLQTTNRAGYAPEWLRLTRVYTDRTGHFVQHAHHLPTSVRIAVEGVEGTYASEPFRLAEPGVRVDLGVQKLTPPSAIEGSVVDAHQRPAAGVRVRLSRGPIANAERITDREGRFRFVGLAPGTATLQLLTGVEASPRRDGEETAVDVVAGRVTAIDLELLER